MRYTRMYRVLRYACCKAAIHYSRNTRETQKRQHLRCFREKCAKYEKAMKQSLHTIRDSSQVRVRPCVRKLKTRKLRQKFGI